VKRLRRWIGQKQKRIQEDREASQPTTIKLKTSDVKTSDGNESASLRAAAHCLTGVKPDKTVAFVLPEGYIGYSLFQRFRASDKMLSNQRKS
jgi:hypothetical protein